jgi:hypothetical protein
MNLQSILNILLSQKDCANLHHALLLERPAGTTARKTLDSQLQPWIQALLCLKRSPGATKSCGSCDSCKLTQEFSDEFRHPDLHLMTPNEKGLYAVEDIRQLLETFSLTKGLSDLRIAWIREADGLSGAHSAAGAANAILKALEEPRPDTLFILDTARPDAMLPTIRSRCLKLRIPGFWLGIPNEVPQMDSSWQQLQTWLAQGAQGTMTLSPADEDSFWKNRESAISQLKEVHRNLWATMRPIWGELPLQSSRKVHFWLTELERTIASVSGNAQGSLQWLNFRMSIKEVERGYS